MMDDVANEMRLENAISAMDKALSGGAAPGQILDNEFQTGVVDVGETEIIYEYEIPPREVVFVKEIANEWYPGVKYIFEMDGERVFDELQRQVAPMNDPRDVEYFAENRIVWRAINEGPEERDLGVITGGKKITDESYEFYKQLMERVGVENKKDGDEPISLGGN